MIFFFSGRPRALLQYQTNLTMWSFASEPEFANHTRAIGAGAIASSFSARSMAGMFERWKKVW